MTNDHSNKIVPPFDLEQNTTSYMNHLQVMEVIDFERTSPWSSLRAYILNKKNPVFGFDVGECALEHSQRAEKEYSIKCVD